MWVYQTFTNSPCWTAVDYCFSYDSQLFPDTCWYDTFLVLVYGISAQNLSAPFSSDILYIWDKSDDVCNSEICQRGFIFPCDRLVCLSPFVKVCRQRQLKNNKKRHSFVLRPYITSYKRDDKKGLYQVAVDDNLLADTSPRTSARLRRLWSMSKNTWVLSMLKQSFAAYCKMPIPSLWSRD
jgi:hypothetical protein